MIANESQMYEMIGRLQVDLVNLRNEYSRLLDVLRLVKSGEMDTANITIDMANLKWTHTAPTEEALTES